MSIEKDSVDIREELIAAKINQIVEGKYHQQRDRRRYRVANGVVYKRCTQCNTFKPVRGSFYWAGTRGTWFSHCKLCHNFNVSVDTFGEDTSDRGLVPWATVQPFFLELVRRVGKAETGRRTGMNKSRVTHYFKTPPLRVFRRTAKSILEAVHEARSRDEVRHFKSIQHGASARGKVERKVNSANDLYVRSEGDKDTEYRRNRRRTDDSFLARERERDRRRRRLTRQAA